MTSQHLSTKTKDIQVGRILTVWDDTSGVKQTVPQNRTLHKPVTLIVTAVSKVGGTYVITGVRAKDNGEPRAKAVEAKIALGSTAEVLVKWTTDETVLQVEAELTEL